jgi:DNA-binding transcriptional ArsR family regulator
MTGHEHVVDEAAVRAVRAAMPTDESVAGVVELFRLLGDPTRARLIFALARTELCVCDLSEALGVSESALSHQLRQLRHLRLVSHRRRGRQVYYTLNDPHLADLLNDVLGLVETREPAA